ncbi:unnamed protein product [Paramecium octaurelia]|uniref:Uncharacterized protein n=1 Tax=Paramecium octaurelia TaxID=43137 RepID=A0A8S1VI16_PAROT|nr:unnamed protein product [Paramecium octaurelia]
MKSLSSDSPITPLTEKSIVITDNNNQDQFYPIIQQNHLIYQKVQQNQNSLLNPMNFDTQTKIYIINQILNIKTQSRGRTNQEIVMDNSNCNYVHSNQELVKKSIDMKSKDVITSKNALNPFRLNNPLIENQEEFKQKESLLRKTKSEQTKCTIKSRNSNQTNSKDQSKINKIVNRLYNQAFLPKKLDNIAIANGFLRGSHNEKHVIHYFFREFYQVLSIATCETFKDLQSQYKLTYQFQFESDFMLIWDLPPNRRLQFEIFQSLKCPTILIQFCQGIYYVFCYVSKVILMKQINFEIMKINKKLNFLFNLIMEQLYSWKLKSLYSISIIIEILNLKYANTSFRTTKQTQMLATQHQKRVASEIQHQNKTLNDCDQIYNKKNQKSIEQQERINQEQCNFNPQVNEAQVKSIAVKQNDTASKLATQLIEKNKIDKESLMNLIKLIQQQLANTQN